MQNTKYHGFTLLEILVVLTIVALMSGVAVLNIRSTTYPKFLSEAGKVASLLELISDHAVYTNSVIACEPMSSGLSCQIYKNSEWNDLNLARIASWQWPPTIKIKRVIVNGLALKDGEKIRFFPNGDLPPMSMEVTNDTYHTWIDSDLSNNFKVNN